MLATELPFKIVKSGGFWWGFADTASMYQRYPKNYYK